MSREWQSSNEWQSRQVALIGEQATEKLARTAVMVFGVGGVGGYAVEALARAGVGRLILVDHDTVSESNRNRQIIALTSTVDCPKVEVFAARIAQINPACRVEVHRVFVTPENTDALIGGAHPDWLVDAIDHVPGKIAIALSAAERGIPLIASMGTGNKICPERLKIGDLSKTSVCPLARVMRRELKNRGISGLTVLWSDELPFRDSASSLRAPASISFVPASAGLLIASHLVRMTVTEEEAKCTVTKVPSC